MTLHSKSGFRRHNLEKKLSPWREKLICHPLYDFINDENSLIILWKIMYSQFGISSLY